MPEQVTREQLIARAKKPAEDALKMHPHYKGKISVTSKCVVRDVNDFAVWYTPGVAAVCKDIQAHPEMVYEHTNKGNMVAVISDGTRVLGLGDIGPEAGIPVMEGKALIFKYLGGVDAFPILLDTKDPDEIIRTVQILQPSFGGINLEDIASPKCFRILDTLRKECRIPVWHDDQQGTAAVTCAGLINALKVVGKDIGDVRVAMIGAGAANIRIANIIIKAGVDPRKVIMCDHHGTLHSGRVELQKEFPEKWDLCTRTNPDNIQGGIPEVMQGADVVIALSQQGPDVIKKEWVSSMAKDAIVFVCANPIPEMWPWDALDAGAKVVATGRSDFPNQVNNSLCFPAIFRGALDVQASEITDEMCIEAARALAAYSEEKHGLSADRLLPTMDEWEVFPYEAAAVGMKAIEQGVAKRIFTRDELFAMASATIKHARDEIDTLMREGLIAPAPAGL